MTRPDSNADSSPPAARRALILAVLVLLLGALAGYYLWSRPVLVFTNRLIGPVRLSVGPTSRTLPPGQTVRLTVAPGKKEVAVWELVRPLSADGRPMGEEVRGSVVVPGAPRTIRMDATARGSDTDYFAPLITNASQDLLRVIANAGLQGALDCGCAVRPGARRVFVGYYRLYRNSTVEARSSDSRTAAFRDLGPRVVSRDGTIGLRFESKDLRQR